MNLKLHIVEFIRNIDIGFKNNVASDNQTDQKISLAQFWLWLCRLLTIVVTTLWLTYELYVFFWKKK